MNILFLALLWAATPAETTLWAEQELKMLQAAYQKYTQNYASAKEKQQKNMDAILAELKPVGTQFLLKDTRESRQIPPLRFFELVDPLTGSSTASNEEKLEAAFRDSGNLLAFTAMSEILSKYHQSPTFDAQSLLVETHKLMRSWAEKAANPKTSDLERKKYSNAFAHMVYEIGQKSELLALAPIYRTRRAFRLETPAMAQQELDRINNFFQSR